MARYPEYVYPLAMVLDLILRVSWVVNLSVSITYDQYGNVLFLVLGILEARQL